VVTEERVVNLETALANFIAHSDRIVVAIHQDIAEMRASNARTDRRLLEMQQQAETDRHQAETDRQHAEAGRQDFDRRMDQFAARAEADRQDFGGRMDQFAARAEADRQQAEKSREDFNRRMDEWARKAEQDRKDFGGRRDQFAARAEPDWQQAEKSREDFNRRTDEWSRKAEQDRKDFHKQWAELSDNRGTLLEDMVAPCGFKLAEAIFGDQEAQTCGIRFKARHPANPGEMMEVDLLAVGPTKVLVGEVNRRIDAAKAQEFREKLQRLPEFFPSLAGKTLCAAVASVYLEPSVIAFLNRQKLYGIAMGDEVMEVVNLGQF